MLAPVVIVELVQSHRVGLVFVDGLVYLINTVDVEQLIVKLSWLHFTVRLSTIQL